MSFRRDAEKVSLWRKRLDARDGLLQRAKLPEFLFRDEGTWMRFLLHGIHEGSHSPPVDVIAMLGDDERRALFELISEVYSEEERSGMSLSKDLKRMLNA